ncbi:MAG: tetratricopeptide repeat protein [Spirochaetia bacterium]|nr:tetratricopeptide repeat protein [Spirochaetia bacterium]
MDFREIIMKGAEALEAGNLQEAEKHFLAAAEMDSTNYLPLYNLGLLASDQEKLDDARTYLEKALVLKKDDADVLTALGTVCLKGGLDSEAESYFLKALKLGESELLYNNMGIIAFRRKNYGRAKELYLKALELNPGYQEARENIALANFYLAMLT